MNTIDLFLQSPQWEPLLRALLHTLWIGALGAVILFVTLRRVSVQRVELRYGMATAVLAATVVGGVLAWAAEAYSPPPVKDGFSINPARADQAMESGENDANIVIQHPPQSSVTPPDDGPSAPSAIVPPPRSRLNWNAFLAVAWLLGVGVMLGRSTRRVCGAGRLLSHSHEATEPALLSQFDQLRRLIVPGRRVGLHLAEDILVPAVIGIFRPVVLLPASVLSGLPPQLLTAVLAHELAHIRRHDYLVNLCQLAIESLLFFNPFIWWISRQIRIEREACCDAEAAPKTGGEFAYASALAEAAEHFAGAQAPAALAAFADPDRPGHLLGRIRRLVKPGEKASLRLPMLGVIFAFSAVIIALMVLKVLSDETVEWVAGKLTPQERIEKITQIQEEYGPDKTFDQWGPGLNSDERPNVLVSGRVRTWDNEPLPRRFHVQVLAQIPSSTMFTGISAKEGLFSEKIPCGNISLWAELPGYATAFAGPYTVKPGESLEGVELTLGPGFPASIHLTGPEGEPVADATVEAWYMHESGTLGHSFKVQSDERGIAALDHLTTTPLQLTVSASGYGQEQRKKVQFNEGEVLDWMLTLAQPAHGVVVSAKDGQPVEGAVLRIVARQGPNSMQWGPQQGPEVATTNPAGEFEIDSLMLGHEHMLVVEAEGYERKLVKIEDVEQQGIQIELSPPLDIRGRVTNLQYLPEELREKPAVKVSQTVKTAKNHSHVFGRDPVPLTIGGNTGYFEVKDLYPGKVTLTVGETRKKFDISAPMEDVEIALEPPASTQPVEKRLVMIRLNTPPKAPPAEGQMQVEYVEYDAKLGNGVVKREEVTLQDGTASLEVPVGAKLELKPTQLVGCWFKSTIYPRTEIVAGEGPQVIDLLVIPAGAIYGSVFEEDGSPATGILISVVEEKKSPMKEDGGSLNVTVKDSAGGAMDTQNTFVATPLPMGGVYRIIVHRGLTYARSEPIPINDAAAIAHITMTLPKGVDIGGRIATSDGAALPPLTLSVSFKGGSNHTIGGEGRFLGNAEFVLEKVNPARIDSYELHVEPESDYQAVRVEDLAPALKAPLSIELQRGLVITGTVLNADTGEPIPNAEVYAHTPHYQGWPNFFDAKVDDKGALRFSTLPPGEYGIGCRSGTISSVEGARQQHQDWYAQAGQEQPVVVKVKPYNRQ